jgi:hypothetical protein
VYHNQNLRVNGFYSKRQKNEKALLDTGPCERVSVGSALFLGGVRGGVAEVLKVESVNEICEGGQAF